MLSRGAKESRTDWEVEFLVVLAASYETIKFSSSTQVGLFLGSCSRHHLMIFLHF
jgi:hypothetical protein